MNAELALLIQQATKSEKPPATVEEALTLLLDDHLVWEKHALTQLVTENSELKGRVRELERQFKHTHVTRQDNTDICRDCGLDLRDTIHRRVGDVY